MNENTITSSVQERQRLCSIEGCTSALAWRGYCRRHYQRWLRHGNPFLNGNDRTQEDIERRFWAKVLKESPDGCWLWQGGTRRGYGRFYESRDRRVVSAHRWAWENRRGRKVGIGLVLRHTCDVKNCVNPDHLLEGTQLENTRDALERGLLPSKAFLTGQSHYRDYVEKRKRVYRRDGGRCVDCGMAGPYGRHKGHLGAYFTDPKSASIETGFTLCINCRLARTVHYCKCGQSLGNRKQDECAKCRREQAARGERDL